MKVVCFLVFSGFGRGWIFICLVLFLIVVGFFRDRVVYISRVELSWGLGGSIGYIGRSFWLGLEGCRGYRIGLGWFFRGGR